MKNNKIMEIKEKLYSQNREKTPIYHLTVFNNKEKNDNYINIYAYNDCLNKIRKSLNEPNSQILSDNITLRTSYDKIRKNIRDSYSIIHSYNKTIDKINEETNANSSKNDISLDLKGQYIFSNIKNDKRKFLAYINNIYNKEIEYENINIVKNNQFFNNKSNIENKIFCDNNINLNLNKYLNNNNSFKKENNKDINIYYNTNNILGPYKYNQLIDNLHKKNIKEKYKNSISNILLTVFRDDNKNIKNENNNDHNNLKDIKQEIITDDNINSYYLNSDYNNNKNNKNIILAISPIKKPKKNYNFMSSTIQKEKEKININSIIKLKNDLNPNEKEELMDNETVNKENNILNKKKESIIENKNIHNSSEQKDLNINELPTDKNIEDEDNNLGSSSEIINLDIFSEYTLQTETNFGKVLIKKKSELSPFYNEILIIFIGILFLLYKIPKIRLILNNIIKTFIILPFFLKGLFCLFVNEIEKYHDSFIILGFFIIIICLYYIFKLLMKKYMKNN